MEIIKCPSCNSEITIDKHTIFSIDCDCGYEILKKDAEKQLGHKLENIESLKMKDYVVSLNVSFSTPLDAKAKSDKEAENKCKTQFKKLFKEFKEKLNDIADLEIETDYIECQD